jgi:hypothetical protein
LTQAEFRFKITGSSYKRVKDYNYTDYQNPLKTSAKLDIVDWRIPGFVTEVKNQRSCTSYWAQAIVDGVEVTYNSQNNGKKRFSAQQIIDCMIKERQGCK